MTVRSRFLAKAALAGALLCCLWFVPSAKAAPPYGDQAPGEGAPQKTSQLVPSFGPEGRG